MKVLIFSLSDKEYAVDISSIREVIRMRPFVPVPDAPAYIAGVAGVRGNVIPFISLRAKLGFPPKESSNKFDRILVTRIGEKHFVGVIVDGVSEVTNIDETTATEPDEMLKDADYLKGVLKMGKRIILMVDIEALLSKDAARKIDDITKRVEVRKR